MSLDAATLGRLERMHHHGHAFQSRPTTGDALRPTGTNAARKAVRDRRYAGGRRAGARTRAGGAGGAAGARAAGTEGIGSRNAPTARPED